MTTVTVVNRGDSPIKIEVQGRNSGGQFTAQAEVFVSPYTFADLSVGNGQSFQVTEIEDDGENQ